MKRFLEKIIHTIIPHEKNGNVPHILREQFLIVIIVFVGVLFYFNQNNFSIIRNLNLSATVYPAVLADLANQDRAQSGVSQLAWSETLEKAAKLKADDMLKNSYFAHTSPSGVTPWYWFRQANYNFIYAGENLAVDFTESINVQKAWLNSPKHKENILNSRFTEIGIATVDGYFEGKNTTFVVEFFGKPSLYKTEEKPINKDIVVNQTDKIITPNVAGVATESDIKKINKVEPNIKVVEETKEFIVVKDESVTEDEVQIVSSDLEDQSMSTWCNRFIVSPTKTIRLAYIIILSLILLSILLMLSKEYKKHHTKHLLMGIILMIVISVLLYIISTNNTQILF